MNKTVAGIRQSSLLLTSKQQEAEQIVAAKRSMISVGSGANSEHDEDSSPGDAGGEPEKE
jgi:hypothetical protein